MQHRIINILLDNLNPNRCDKAPNPSGAGAPSGFVTKNTTLSQFITRRGCWSAYNILRIRNQGRDHLLNNFIIGTVIIWGKNRLKIKDNKHVAHFSIWIWLSRIREHFLRMVMFFETFLILATLWGKKQCCDLQNLMFIPFLKYNVHFINHYHVIQNLSL